MIALLLFNIEFVHTEEYISPIIETNTKTINRMVNQTDDCPLTCANVWHKLWFFPTQYNVWNFSQAVSNTYELSQRNFGV